MTHNPYNPPKSDIKNHQDIEYPTKKVLWNFNITSLLLLFLISLYLDKDKLVHIFDIKIIIMNFAISISVLIIPNLMASFYLFYKKYDKGLINFLKIMIGYFLLLAIYKFIAFYLLEIFVHKVGMSFFEWLTRWIIVFLRDFSLLLLVGSFITSTAMIFVLPDCKQKENL